MIKGLTITPPVLGRISIGKVVEANGKRLPEKDDQFTITTQVQTRDGWIKHPYDKELRENAENGKLRRIPVRMLFNDPDLNLRAEYTLFDRSSGRPLCAGDGVNCRRHTKDGVEVMPCPTPDHCDLGKQGACKPYGRLNVCIGDEDNVGTFIFRTTGYNSIRTLMARLQYFRALSGDLLAALPLELKLRGKSTAQSHRSAVYYVDLTLREGVSMREALEEAQSLDKERWESGFNQHALDEAARNGFANALFEEDAEAGAEIVEEFYHERTQEPVHTATVECATAKASQGMLADKLVRKAAGP